MKRFAAFLIALFSIAAGILVGAHVLLRKPGRSPGRSNGLKNRRAITNGSR